MHVQLLQLFVESLFYLFELFLNVQKLKEELCESIIDFANSAFHLSIHPLISTPLP